MPKVTLQSIADRLGVSRMTVSNAFSRPDQLSGALRERILAEADALGYVGPDPSARSLARGTTGTIGVLWSGRLRDTMSDEVSAGFLGAIADELAPDGLALTLLPAVVDGEVIPVRDVAMDGAIAYSCPPDSPALGWLERRKVPLVYVDMPPRAGVAAVTIDDRGGARAAAQHLIDLGHRRIAVVSAGFGDVPGVVDLTLAQAIKRRQRRVTDQRLRGWRDALVAADIEPILVSQPDVYLDSRPAVRAVLTSGVRPTAVLCLTDVVAAGVLSAAQELGLRVPDDLAVVGFDNNPLALRTSPPLTTIAQDVDAKGRMAAAALRQAMRHARDAAEEAPRSRTLDVDLIIRASTVR